MFDDNDFESFLGAVAGIESGGWENPYEAVGGSGNHYDGKYQMGEAAKESAGKVLGMKLLHTPAARKAFRNDPELQERAMRAFTEYNHERMIKKQGSNYQDLDAQEKLAVLGYAHNQGAGGASKWMRSGYEDVGEDGFGTKGTRYSSAVRGALGNAGPSDYASILYHNGKDTLRSARDVAQEGYDWVEKSTPAVMETLDNSYESLTNGFNSLFGGVDHSKQQQFDEIGPKRFAYHIARDNNMTLDELQALNPDQEITRGSQGTRMPAGLKLRVGGYENIA